jgi:hypothetical protein
MAGWLRSEMLQQTLYFPQSRAARLIATGRVVFAAVSLFAIWLDPAAPAKYAEITYTLLVAYVLYALLLAAIVWRVDAPLRGVCWITHAGDLLMFSIFMYLTEGPTSPFFVYFLFSLLCATLYWQWRGIMWTAVVGSCTQRLRIIVLPRKPGTMPLFHTDMRGRCHGVVPVFLPVRTDRTRVAVLPASLCLVE